jgi:hypothetical protein
VRADSEFYTSKKAGYGKSYYSRSTLWFGFQLFQEDTFAKGAFGRDSVQLPNPFLVKLYQMLPQNSSHAEAVFGPPL